jgi:hypothetical protein
MIEFGRIAMRPYDGLRFVCFLVPLLTRNLECSLLLFIR